MKIDFTPVRFFYTNDSDQERNIIANYPKVCEELRDSENELRELKETKYKEIAYKVNLDISEFNKLKGNMANYGKFFQEVFKEMKDRGFTQKEFDEIGEKYGLDLSYLF